MKILVLLEIQRKVYNAHTKELDEIQELIDKLNIENPFITEEYIQYDDSEVITDMIFNEEILKVVFSNNNNHQEKGTEDSDPLPSITHNEAINYYDKILMHTYLFLRVYAPSDALLLSICFHWSVTVWSLSRAEVS
ncbi:hypothetical protein RhiirB3_392399 [Rhizophagus irregularis]|nr:hypothetical protein RhiirB3_493450 [Rhizophagus irregularis]PKY30224.1 hypothetical protein RhiirB3_392399 [Rhizophagus irregularis]